MDFQSKVCEKTPPALTYNHSYEVYKGDKQLERMTGDQNTGIETWAFQLSLYETILILHALDRPELYNLPEHEVYGLEDLEAFIKRDRKEVADYKKEFLCYLQEVVTELKNGKENFEN